MINKIKKLFSKKQPKPITKEIIIADIMHKAITDMVQKDITIEVNINDSREGLKKKLDEIINIKNEITNTTMYYKGIYNKLDEKEQILNRMIKNIPKVGMQKNEEINQDKKQIS